MTTIRRGLAAVAALTTTLSLGALAAPSASAATDTVPGETRTRALVPWENIGADWIAMSAERQGSTHLVLVSPQGQSYEITTLPKGTMVTAFSADHEHVLTTDGVYTTKTGQKVKGSTDGTTFAADGRSVLRTGPNASGIERVSLDGKRLSAHEVPGGGEPRSIAPSHDGRTIAVSTVGKVQVLDATTLEATHDITVPKGFTTCNPDRFVDAKNFHMTCVDNTPASKSHTQKPTTVFRVSIDGVNHGPVTSATYRSGSMGRTKAGFVNVWQTSHGPVGETYAPAGEVSSPVMFSLDSNTMYLPKPTSSITAPGQVGIERVVGDAVYLREGQHEAGDPTIADRWDLTTGEVIHLGGEKSQYGGTVTNYALAGDQSHAF